jgi:hypothetical protein
MNMKKMRYLFLVLALGFGLCAQRAQSQTVGQPMTFSIICQYVTNIYTTNASTKEIYQNQLLTTVLLSSANLIKAMIVDTFWRNNATTWQSNFTYWSASTLSYEENMITGNQGIYLVHGTNQLNVTSFFGTNIFSTNSVANMFAQDATNVFSGTIYPAISTNGYANLLSGAGSTNFDDAIIPDSTLPLSGGYGFFYTNSPATSNNYAAYDNLAYLTFNSSNISFNLFGYSQGALVIAAYDNNLLGKVDQGQIVGAGTFNLNLTTNFLRLTSNFVYYVNLSADVTTNHTVTNAIPATNYSGLAHGTVFVGKPFRLNFGPPEGP